MNGLLEGLEISILPLTEVLNDNRDSRLDSQYFRKLALFTDDQISRHAPSELRNVASKVLSFGAYALTNEFEYQEAGVPFLRGTNFHGDFVNFSGALCISEDAHGLLHKSEVKPGMVLLSMSGSVGSVSVALDTWRYPINSNQDIAKIVPDGISSFYLAAYLASKHGQVQIERQPVGSVQQHIFLWMIERLKIPRFSEDFEREISRATEHAYTLHETVPQLMTSADGLLMKSLGLADWTPPEPLTYAAKASDALAAGRLDAQYFMPAKEQVKRALAALPGMPLSSRVNSIREQWVPDRAPPTMQVRNYDVTDALVQLLDAEKEPSFAADIGSMKKVLHDGDVAVSRLRAYLKEIAVVRTGDAVPSVGSSEFIVLRPKGADISPETLMVFLRSQPVQTILKWCQDGSQHPRFSESDLLSIPVPDAVAEASATVTLIVQEGFAARDRARRLLDAAKRAVEIAIEDSEAAALAYFATVEGTN